LSQDSQPLTEPFIGIDDEIAAKQQLFGQGFEEQDQRDLSGALLGPAESAGLPT
jgi:hypothetical protein